MSDEIEYLILRTEKIISLLNESEMQVKWDWAESYVKELDLIREDIAFLTSKAPEKAKSLMLDLIDTNDSIFDRITGTDFKVEDFYQKCVEDLVEILAKIPSNIEEITDIAHDITCMYDLSDGYYFNNNAVSSFKELLSKSKRFDRLKDKLTERLSNTNKKRNKLICRIENALKEITHYMRNGIAAEYNDV